MSGAITAVAVGLGSGLAASAMGAGVLAATAMGVGAGALTAMNAKSNKQQLNAQQQQVAAQREQQQFAIEQAKKQEQESMQAMNKANQKRPDTSTLLQSAMQAGQGGVGSTLLTGPQGVEQKTLGGGSLLGS